MIARRAGLVLIGLGAAALVLAVALALWLARSSGGRDWLLARVVASLPAGSELSWQRIDGSLSGPLDVRGLRYVQPDGLRIEAGRVRIDHSVWPLLSGRWQVRRLQVDDARLVLARDEPFEWPRWPEVLPALDLPFELAVAQLQVRRLQVASATGPLLAISRADGAVTIGPGRLSATQLSVASDRGHLQLELDYRPRDNYRTTLDARLRFPALAGQPAASARAIGKGDLDDFVLGIDGAAPAPLRANLRLRDGRGAPRWSLDAASTRLLPALLGLAPEEPAYAFDLHVRGRGGHAGLAGRVSRDGRELRIAKSSLRATATGLRFAPLAVTLDEGPLALAGELDFGQAQPRFDLRLHSPGLRLGAASAVGAATPATLARGEVRAVGQWRAWRLTGDASIRRGDEQARVQLEGRGDAGQLTVSRLLATMPSGELRGSGRLRWSPTWLGSADLRLAGFDPGYFVPDFPGALDGAIALRAERPAGQDWRGSLQVSDLRGQLRKRPLQGEAQLDWQAGVGDGRIELRLGDSRIAASGRFGDQLDLQARFEPLDLADLWPDAGGRLQGRVAVRGPRQAPALEASLVGARLRWGSYQADRLDLQGRLPATGAGGRLDARAEGLRLAGQAFDRANLALTGSAAAFQARGALAGAPGELSFEGNASGRGERWQGRLAALRLAPRHGAAWRLGGPAGFRWQAGQLRFERACLSADAGVGQVCAQFDGDRATVSGRALALALVEPWLGDAVAGVRSFGSLDLDGHLVRDGATWNGALDLRSERGGLRLSGEEARTLFEFTALQLRLQVRQSRFDLELGARLGDGGTIAGTARGGLAAEAPLQGELRLDLRDLTWMELLSPDLAAPTGRIAGRVLIGGSLAAPQLGGEARLAPFGAELPALGVVLREGDFQLRGAADGQARISGQVRSGRGVLRVDGQLNLRDRSSPLELTLRGEDITVVDTPDLEATMSPELSLRHVQGNLQIRGVVVVPSARIDLERLDSGIAPSTDVVVLDPRAQDLRTGLLVDTDLELRLGEDVRLRGFGLDGELGGRLRVRDPPGREALVTGTLEVGGRYTAYGRPLQIKRGRLSYLNAPIDDPVLDVLAEHEFEQATIGVRVRGSALAPETSITSSPPMATSEALSWLLLGRPLQTASSSETQRISASAIALGAGSSLLAQRLGARLGLDSASITESRTLGSTLMVGKQVSPRLFVSYGLSLVGTGQVVMLKYLLTRGLDVALESGSVETAASINWRKEK